MKFTEFFDMPITISLDKWGETTRGSVGKGTCCHGWWPESSLSDPHHLRRQTTPTKLSSSLNIQAVPPYYKHVIKFL